MTIDGRYVYLATDTYPFIGRCLMGEVATGPGGGETGGAPPGDRQGETPSQP